VVITRWPANRSCQARVPTLAAPVAAVLSEKVKIGREAGEVFTLCLCAADGPPMGFQGRVDHVTRAVLVGGHMEAHRNGLPRCGTTLWAYPAHARQRYSAD